VFPKELLRKEKDKAVVFLAEFQIFVGIVLQEMIILLWNR
jgi:hypothetical protein